jgi:lipopolysaccharide transport system permease protein
VRFAVQMLLMIIMMFFYYYKGASFHITWAILLFPILVLLMALLGLGLGLIITALTTKYRDLSFLITFGVQLLMYTTTVIYPLSSAPEKYKSLISLNPMTGIIECFRFALFGQGFLTINSIAYSTIFTFISLVIGVLIFNKTEKTFVDTV